VAPRRTTVVRQRSTPLPAASYRDAYAYAPGYRAVDYDYAAPTYVTPGTLAPTYVAPTYVAPDYVAPNYVAPTSCAIGVDGIARCF
jgi:hypothetical protein